MESAMNEPALDLKAALTDVRRAFRLIYAYQRRVSDILAEVSAALDANGLKFFEWSPHLFGPPARSGTEFFRADRWAWDMMPGYSPRCEWRSEAVAVSVRRVVLVVRADSGFRTQYGEPDPQDFVSVEDATSDLRVGLWRASAKVEDWEMAVKTVHALPDVFDGKERAARVGPAEVAYRHLAVELADLPDAAAVRTRLLDPLTAWAKST